MITISELSFAARRVHDGDADLPERRQLAGIRTEVRLESGRTLLSSRHLQIRIDQPKLNQLNFIHRSRETRLNLLFQFALEKIGCFYKHQRYFLVFQNLLFFPISPTARFVRSPVVYVFSNRVFLLRRCLRRSLSYLLYHNCSIKLLQGITILFKLGNILLKRTK